MNFPVSQPTAEIEFPVSDALSESNHRICNHLGILVGMIRCQINRIEGGAEDLSRQTAKEMLHATAGALVSVSRLHHQLSQRPLDDIWLSHHVVEVCRSLIASLNLSGRVFFVHNFKADLKLSPSQAQNIGLLINEVMINAIKYAHPAGLPVKLEICCERHDNGSVSICIGDDGVGLSEGGAQSGSGVGFKLIRTLVKSIKGRLEIQSDALGLTFSISLPHQEKALRASLHLAQ
jgi:two-component sensor histidine kinase